MIGLTQMVMGSDKMLPIWAVEDAVGIDRAQVKYANPAVHTHPITLAIHLLQAAAYWISWIVVGGFFGLGLFVASLMSQFHKQAEKLSGAVFLDEKQSMWYEKASQNKRNTLPPLKHLNTG